MDSSALTGTVEHPPPATGGGTPRRRGGSMGQTTRTFIPLFLFVALFAAMAIVNAEAVSSPLLQSVVENTVPLMIIAFGQTLVILTGGVDLSVGGVMSVAGALLVTKATTTGDLAIWVPVILLVGLGAGALNGVLVVRTGIQPFIVTLASWSVFSGIAFLVLPTDGGTVAESLSSLLGGDLAGVKKALFITLLLFLIWRLIRSSRFGQSIYAIGSHEHAAYLNGIRTDRVKVGVYALSGLFAAIAAIYYSAVLAFSSSPTVGDAFILQSVAAVVIGGTSLFGGRGGFGGTILGALTLSLIAQLVFFANAQSYFAQLFQGVLVLVAVLTYAAIELLIQRRSLSAGGEDA